MSRDDGAGRNPSREALEQALRRECEAHRRLLHVAAALEAAGHAEQGALARETALAQAAHAVEILDLLRAGSADGDPIAELRTALAVQREEADHVYPGLAAQARAAGDAPAAAVFERLARAEATLCARLARGLQAAGAGGAAGE